MIIARRLVLGIFLLGWAGGCSGDDDGDEADTASENDALAAPDDVAGIPGDAMVTASGLGWRILVQGTGTRSPERTDTVRVHYTGWQTNGFMFDSSHENDGPPIEFEVTRVIRGWTEALQLMVEGEERRLWIPANLAYEGVPNRPQGMLVFDVELLAIVTP
jgi:peptidylprolyl isomerase